MMTAGQHRVTAWGLLPDVGPLLARRQARVRYQAGMRPVSAHNKPTVQSMSPPRTRDHQVKYIQLNIGCELGYTLPIPGGRVAREAFAHCENHAGAVMANITVHGDGRTRVANAEQLYTFANSKQ